jgi:hypothetical protein
MNTYNEAKCFRSYDIFAAGTARCDLCKSFKISFELIPNDRLHNFDSIFLCKNCISKVGLDIREDVVKILDIKSEGLK